MHGDDDQIVPYADSAPVTARTLLRLAIYRVTGSNSQSTGKADMTFCTANVANDPKRTSVGSLTWEHFGEITIVLAQRQRVACGAIYKAGE
jgi:hypothetical protein